MTSRSTWKRHEREVARDFGAERQRCSGSSGLAHESRSDSTHNKLFVECKLRAKDATRNLYDQTKILARKEGKTPVLALKMKGRPGYLIVVHCDDFLGVIDAITQGGVTAFGLADDSSGIRHAGGDDGVSECKTNKSTRSSTATGT